MALRVLHVIGGGDTGGAMSHLLPLLSALGGAGCEVHLLCLGDGGLADAAKDRGFAVTVLPMKGAHDPRVLRRLRHILASGSTEGVGRSRPGAPWSIVHTHGMRANLPVRLVVSGLSRRPCLFTTVHSDIRLDYRRPALGRAYAGLDRASLGPVDAIVCVSESLREVLVRRGYPSDKLLTIRSGLEPAAAAGKRAAMRVDVEEPLDMAERADRWPAERRPCLGTTTRLVAVKDVDLLLEVASLLSRSHPRVECLVMGDGPERQRLEARAEQMGLAGIVRFAGRVADVREGLRRLDVFIVTSVYEGGVSMSVLEAMEAGLPVVVTAAGGVEEAVVDGETGYIVSREQERGALAAALAERAAALLDDPGLRARMGQAGARRVRREFTIERTAAQTLRAYERCLAARGRL